MPSGSRPSVLSIKCNNRGMVKQRINHFARLEIQKTIGEQVCFLFYKIHQYTHL